MADTPKLDALFADVAERLPKLRGEIDDPFVFQSAEKLLEDALGLSVRGAEKLGTVARASKFLSVLSEIRIANLFARLGCSVEIAADEAFGGNGLYTPDLLVEAESVEILVEVVSGSGGSIELAPLIDTALKEKALPFRVDCHLVSDLSGPGIGFEERSQTERRAQAMVEKLIEHLEGRDEDASGSVFVDGSRFDYKPSPLDGGYYSGGTTGLHLVRSDDHANKLLRELERKAKGQLKLPLEKRVAPFVVAYDNRESELRPTAVHSAVTGSRVRCPGPEDQRLARVEEMRASYPKALVEALSGRWSRLLRDWDYGPGADVYLSSYGALFEDKWAQCLSAVLVTHVGGQVQWYPNPFAQPDLQVPWLLELPLPTTPRLADGETWTHPAWHRYP